MCASTATIGLRSRAPSFLIRRMRCSLDSGASRLIVTIWWPVLCLLDPWIIYHTGVSVGKKGTLTTKQQRSDDRLAYCVLWRRIHNGIRCNSGAAQRSYVQQPSPSVVAALLEYVAVVLRLQCAQMCRRRAALTRTVEGDWRRRHAKQRHY